MALKKKIFFMSFHQHDNDDGGGRESKKKFYANFSWITSWFEITSVEFINLKKVVAIWQKQAMGNRYSDRLILQSITDKRR